MSYPRVILGTLVLVLVAGCGYDEGDDLNPLSKQRLRRAPAS
jgi:hypothetical protein